MEENKEKEPKEEQGLETDKPLKKKKDWVTIIIIAAIAFLAVFGLCYYILSSSSQKDTDASSQASTAKRKSTPTPTPAPTATPKPTATPTASSPEISGWLTYTNTKYGYSFKHPADYKVTDSCKAGNCVIVSQGGDSVILQGDLSSKGWPMVDVHHYSTEYFNPPAGTDLTTWVKQKFASQASYVDSGTKINLPLKSGGTIEALTYTEPKSPQSYARKMVYYLKDNKLFEVVMLDAESPASLEFYQTWLTTYIAN